MTSTSTVSVDGSDGQQRRGVVLLPTYNERENLAAIVAAIFEAQPSLDILVIDDASPDGTGDIADGIAAGEPRLSVLHRSGKEGLGRAYLDGFAHALADNAGYDLLVQMDADFSHDPRHLAAILDAASAGADVVIGSRYVKGGRTVGWSWHRRWLSRAGGTYARLVLGVGIRDLTAGFVCYHREVLEALDLAGVEASGYGFQIEMKFRCERMGFAIREVPIAFPDRQVGTSKMSLGIMAEALGLVWRLRLRGRGVFAARGARA